jgi:phospholipid transport system substrate-binding protein
MLNRRNFQLLFSSLFIAPLLALPLWATAADLAPEVMVNQVTTDVMQTIRSDKSYAGDVAKIAIVVEQKIMPHVNFRRMTAAAVGPAWNKATPEQQLQIQDEFKTLLIRIYSGALSQINNQTFSVRSPRYSPEDSEVIIRTEVRGNGDPLQLDYRLEKASGQGLGWKIINFNVVGVWMMETYRGQFAKIVNADGIDGLIASLKERNKSNLKK